MNYLVSVSDFRKNMPDYFDLAMAGKTVTVNDEKRGVNLVKIIKADEHEFDWDEYMKFIENFEPVFTDEDVKSISTQRKKSRNRMKRVDW